jgi:uncharacterized Zn finger protein
VSRENIYEKGCRYLTEGRLCVSEVDEHAATALAEVRGDSGAVYVVLHDESGWHCDCPARGRCAHVVALQRVVVLEPQEAR